MTQLNPFLTEIWIIFAIAVAFTGIRVLTRVRSVGWRGFQADDYLALGAILFFTGQVVIAYFGGSLYYSTVGKDSPSGPPLAPPEPNSRMTHIRAQGAKYHLALWLLYAGTLWFLKASLVALYMRLTTGLAGTYRIRVLFGFGLLITSLVVVYLTVFLTCQPFNDYFDSVSPVVRNVCTPAVSKPIVWTCYSLNVITDLYVIALPLPLLFKTTMKMWKKVGLGILFSGGAIVIVFATIRCVLLSIDPKNGAPLSGNWGLREAFVAIITTNFPVVFTLIKGMLGPAFKSVGTTDQYNKAKASSRAGGGAQLDTFGSSSKDRRSRKVRDGTNRMTTTQMLFSESEEKIVKEAGDFAGGDDAGSSRMSERTLRSNQSRTEEAELDIERSAPRSLVPGGSG